MVILEKVLQGSERVYRCLVKIHPKAFRAEYESEMVQNFRDLCREQLGRASSMRVMGLWSHTVLDLAASAAIEHLKRRKPMNTLDQDLRWDLRYGVQMFCKHALWLLKYAILAITVGTVALVLAAWIWSGVRIWHREQPVNNAWQQITGKTPGAYFQSVMQQFPKSSMNETARQLEKMTTRLGIINPMPNRLYGGERKRGTGPFGTVDVPIHVLSELRKPTDDLSEAPAELQRYLQNHRADLDGLYSLIQRSDVPRWETDLSQLVGAPVPQLFYHRQLQGLIAFDILEKTRTGENESALRALESSWKINQSLRDRPELLSQLIAVSVLRLQAEAMRKMKGVPVEWWRRLDVQAWQESFLRAMELDAVVTSKYVTDSNHPLPSPAWFKSVVNSPLGKPLRHLAGIESLELSGEIFSLIKRSNLCSLSPDTMLKEEEGSRSRWNLATHYGYTNYLRARWLSTETLADAELSRKVLQVKAARDSAKNRDWALQLAPMKSSLCPEAEWIHEVAPNGTIQIQCRNLPEWLKKEHPSSTPLKYSLAPASQRRAPL